MPGTHKIPPQKSCFDFRKGNGGFFWGGRKGTKTPGPGGSFNKSLRLHGHVPVESVCLFLVPVVSLGTEAPVLCTRSGSGYLYF